MIRKSPARQCQDPLLMHLRSRLVWISPRKEKEKEDEEEKTKTRRSVTVAMENPPIVPQTAQQQL